MQRCAGFSNAGSVKVLARRHALSALDGVRRAPIASAHASLSASSISRADASSTSVSRRSSISHLPSLVDEGQQRLQHRRADAFEHVGFDPCGGSLGDNHPTILESL